MKTEMFEPVLDWLDAGAPETQGFSLDMGKFQSQTSCGTTCCIAGAINQFNELGIAPSLYHEYAIDEIRNIIGLTKEQAADLFYAGTHFGNGGCLLPADKYLEDVTPAGAAHAIRTFLKTGKADWSKFDD